MVAVRRFCLAGGVWVTLGLFTCPVAACGHVPPTGPTTTTPLTGPGSLRGNVSWAVDGGPVSSVGIDFEGVTGLTDSQGAFALSNVYTDAPGRIILSGSNIVTRETRVQATESKSGVMLDVIAADFLTFYRYIARDNHDLPQVLKPTARWTTNPSFYIKTVLDDTAGEVPLEIVADVVRVLENSVPELTAGKYLALAIESGRETRPRTEGWVNVSFRRSFPGGILGQTLVAANPGTMEIIYDPALDAAGVGNPSNCRSITVAVAEHEVVHAMGFYHTSSSRDFRSGPGCPGIGRPEPVRRAAAIVYSRPPRNQDPDRDPIDTVLTQSHAGAHRTMLSCDARHIR